MPSKDAHLAAARENQVFSQYMPPANVTRLVLGHYLKQIEKSATKLATDAGAAFAI